MKSSTRQFWQAFIMLSAALSVVAIYQTEQQTQALLKIHSRYKWVLVIAVFAINLGAGIYLLLRGKQNDAIWQKLEFPDVGIVWKVAGTILLLVSIPILWYAKFIFFGKAVPSFFPLLWVWLWLTLIQAAGIKNTYTLFLDCIFRIGFIVWRNCLSILLRTSACNRLSIFPGLVRSKSFLLWFSSFQQISLRD